MSNSLAAGIDIVEIERMKRAIDTWHDSFLNRVFTFSELEICGGNPARLAGRFAAKEAVLKALNPDVITCNWRDIEILASASGRPLLKLHGKAVYEYNRKNIMNLDVSISHCHQYAVAIAVAQ
ncbi:MAG: holo-ACP synthase [Dehalococcoidaceae bacterium]|nr:holo-ACP synthase [Dehalococcoidaceae bacterium]